MSTSQYIYAIDFGTSNSLMGVADTDKIHPLVPLDQFAPDPTVMRSLIYFEPGVGARFGEEAIKQFVQNSMSGRFLKSFKRFLPQKSFEGTVVDGKHWQLDDLIARFLREMRERANAHLDKDITSVVLGRPALFSEDVASDELAQSRLESAAKKAGFRHIEFLPEPVAAAYRYRLEMKKEEVVLVADFGGGTSDYTVIKLSQKQFQPQDVLAMGGAAVAGDALDGCIMRYKVAKHFGADVSYSVPMSSNVLQMPKGLMSHLCSTAYIQFLKSRENREFLKKVKSWSLNPKDRVALENLEILLENQLGFAVFERIEAAKKTISTAATAQISFKYPGIEIEDSLTQKQFKEYSNSEVSKIFSALDETLRKCNLQPTQIDRICCTGGTAKVALIKQELSKRFDENRIENFRNFTSIVEGLAERGQQLLRHSG
jgi:hypothetical chaperone protein